MGRRGHGSFLLWWCGWLFGFGYSKARGGLALRPCTPGLCRLRVGGLGVPLDATGRVARGLGLPQGLRSTISRGTVQLLADVTLGT